MDITIAVILLIAIRSSRMIFEVLSCLLWRKRGKLVSRCLMMMSWSKTLNTRRNEWIGNSRSDVEIFLEMYQEPLHGTDFPVFKLSILTRGLSQVILIMERDVSSKQEKRISQEIYRKARLRSGFCSSDNLLRFK